jgi:AcrR family transcriptional regulator
VSSCPPCSCLSWDDLQVQKLTAKGWATRQRIIEGAAAEIRVRGVALTTLEDIMARTHTSKSQLFHYFPAGKEQLLLAVAAFESQMVIDDQQPHLAALIDAQPHHSERDRLLPRRGDSLAAQRVRRHLRLPDARNDRVHANARPPKRTPVRRPW